jgi:hypothetical protein
MTLPPGSIPAYQYKMADMLVSRSSWHVNDRAPFPYGLLEILNYGPEFDSASNKNKHQESSCEGGGQSAAGA